jgi:hypothetical protein
MEHETAGDPISGLKWTRKTTKKVAQQLAKLGIKVSSKTVGRILKKLDYSLRVNHKKISSGSGPDRNAQFEKISAIRDQFQARGLPVISVDTKKKELVGNFKNGGTAWNKHPVAVNDHDFRSLGRGLAVPYGIYDIRANRGSVFVGTSHDTAQFAVSSIEKWWRYDGRRCYSGANELLILADAGGSNGYRCRAWKHGLQQLSNRYQIAITVSHYPPGASKWNPIEHRLFCEISKNWAGQPLNSFTTVANYISTTSTVTGLTVKAYIDPKDYAKNIKINAEQMRRLNLQLHDILPKWNYTIKPS